MRIGGVVRRKVSGVERPHVIIEMTEREIILFANGLTQGLFDPGVEEREELRRKFLALTCRELKRLGHGDVANSVVTEGGVE